jgi:hypothetical protein
MGVCSLTSLKSWDLDSAEPPIFPSAAAGPAGDGIIMAGLTPPLLLLTVACAMCAVAFAAAAAAAAVAAATAAATAAVAAVAAVDGTLLGSGEGECKW